MFPNRHAAPFLRVACFLYIATATIPLFAQKAPSGEEDGSQIDEAMLKSPERVVTSGRFQ
jgi:hypothetical protein